MSVSEGESVKLRGNIRRQKSCSTDNFEYVVMNLLHRHDFKTTIAIATQKLDGINQQIDRPVCEVHSIQLIADQQQRTPRPSRTVRPLTNEIFDRRDNRSHVTETVLPPEIRREEHRQPDGGR